MPCAGVDTAVTDSVSPSGSESLVSTLRVGVASSSIVVESLPARGGSLDGVTISFALALAVSPPGSITVYSNVMSPLKSPSSAVTVTCPLPELTTVPFFTFVIATMRSVPPSTSVSLASRFITFVVFGGVVSVPSDTASATVVSSYTATGLSFTGVTTSWKADLALSDPSDAVTPIFTVPYAFSIGLTVMIMPLPVPWAIEISLTSTMLVLLDVKV